MFFTYLKYNIELYKKFARRSAIILLLIFIIFSFSILFLILSKSTETKVEEILRWSGVFGILLIPLLIVFTIPPFTNIKAETVISLLIIFIVLFLLLAIIIDLFYGYGAKNFYFISILNITLIIIALSIFLFRVCYQLFFISLIISILIFFINWYMHKTELTILGFILISILILCSSIVFYLFYRILNSKTKEVKNGA